MSRYILKEHENNDGLTAFEMEELQFGNSLTLSNGVLNVNTASSAEQDNTLPITSAAVHVEIGNIEVLLAAL